VHLESKLVWWSAVLFNLEDWKNFSCKVFGLVVGDLVQFIKTGKSASAKLIGLVVGGLVQLRILEIAQMQSRLVWWSVVLFNFE
jgi:hypothetical protein